MDLASILFVVIVFLTATAIFVILFERLGFGAILGFIVAGIVIRDGLALNVLMLLWPLEGVMEWQSGG